MRCRFRRIDPFFLMLFLFNDTAPTEIYPLPLPDALPIPGIEAKPSDSVSRSSRFSSLSALHVMRSEEQTSEIPSPCNLVCRLLLVKKTKITEKKTHDKTVCNTLKYTTLRRVR